MQFETVFDASKLGFQNWGMLTVLIYTVIATCFLFFAPDFTQRFIKRIVPFLIVPSGNKEFQSWMPKKYFFKFIFWGNIFFIAAFSSFLIAGFLEPSSKDILATGKYETTEGIITNYHTHHTHVSHELSFEVNHVRFWWSEEIKHTEFFHTPEYVGPIQPGVYVKISYIDPDNFYKTIIKLEVAKPSFKSNQTKL